MRRLVVLLGSATLEACGLLDPAVGERVTPPDTSAPIEAPEANAADSEEERIVPLDAGGVVFKRDIRPLINRSADDVTGRGCKYCHFPNEGTHSGVDIGGLDLSTLAALRKGGNRTRNDIILVFDPGRSALILKLRGTYDGGKRMPRNGPPFWSDEEIALVETWIAEGARGDDLE